MPSPSDRVLCTVGFLPHSVIQSDKQSSVSVCDRCTALVICFIILPHNSYMYLVALIVIRAWAAQVECWWFNFREEHIFCTEHIPLNSIPVSSLATSGYCTPARALPGHHLIFASAQCVLSAAGLDCFHGTAICAQSLRPCPNVCH